MHRTSSEVQLLLRKWPNSYDWRGTRTTSCFRTGTVTPSVIDKRTAETQLGQNQCSNTMYLGESKWPASPTKLQNCFNIFWFRKKMLKCLFELMALKRTWKFKHIISNSISVQVITFLIWTSKMIQAFQGKSVDGKHELLELQKFQNRFFTF